MANTANGASANFSPCLANSDDGLIRHYGAPKSSIVYFDPARLPIYNSIFAYRVEINLN